MIKRKYDIVPVFRSVKKFNSGMLVKNTSTGQFGTVRSSSMRGKQARRNIINSFEPVFLYIVDSDGEAQFHDFVLFTLDTGEKISGRKYEFQSDNIKAVERIILYPGDVMNAWVAIGSDSSPLVQFKNLTVKTIDSLLQDGRGVIWLELDVLSNPKMQAGHPIIHLNN